MDITFFLGAGHETNPIGTKRATGLELGPINPHLPRSL